FRRSSPFLFAPFFILFALHGRCIRVLHFEPIRRAARAKIESLRLRHDAFELKARSAAANSAPSSPLGNRCPYKSHGETVISIDPLPLVIIPDEMNALIHNALTKANPI